VTRRPGLITRRALVVGRLAALCGLVGLILLVTTKGIGFVIGVALILIFCLASLTIGLQLLREMRNKAASDR
jgi:hypothetical protein